MQFLYLYALLSALPVFALDQVPLEAKGINDCGNRGICPSPGTLDLQYGHCYTMVDTIQRPIQRNDRTYIMDGTTNGLKALTFRICNSTVDCNQLLHQWVPTGGNWFQLDQQGFRDDKAPGWLGRSGFTWYLTDVKDTSQLALNLTAKSTYILGGWALCLRMASRSYLD